eukprot:Gb_35458 [translate_table: standard]
MLEWNASDEPIGVDFLANQDYYELLPYSPSADRLQTSLLSIGLPPRQLVLAILFGIGHKQQLYLERLKRFLEPDQALSRFLKWSSDTPSLSALMPPFEKACPAPISLQRQLTLKAYQLA